MIEMAKFNKRAVPQAEATKTVNLAGGEAYIETPELELVSLLLTNFVQDQFYRKAEDTLTRLRELVAACDPEFVAKAAIFARDKFQMRSITHVTAAEVASRASGQPWARRFYNSVVVRPDDMTETIAYYIDRNGRRPLPNAMKRGFADAFSGFDGYQLAKYRGEGRSVSLVDVVNLVHPRATDKNSEALKSLVAGTLRSDKTWEAMLSAAGQDVESDDDKAEAKAEAWASVVNDGSIGFMALIKNLRNIIEQADAQTKANALELVINRKKILNSRVLPFRLVTAANELKSVPGSAPFIAALSKALDIAVENVPVFEGATLVAVDVSMSMSGRPSEIASMFAAALYKGAGDVDVMTFDGAARYKNLDPTGSVMSLAGQIRGAGGSTNFRSIFETAKRKYDRIIILSDMQAWVGYYAPGPSFSAYKRKFEASPKVFTFDLQNYGTLQFPEKDVYSIAGFSEKVFDLMKVLEQDKRALVNAVRAIEL